MAITMLGSANQRITYGDPAFLGGMTAFSIACTILTPASLVGQFLVSQWGNGFNEQCLFMGLPAGGSDEIQILCHGGGGVRLYLAFDTTDSPVTTSTLLRIVGRLNLTGATGDIWVNGAVRAVTQTFNDGPTTTANVAGLSNLSIAHQAAFPIDGLDGEYSEVAIWNTFVPNWVCEAYGKGMSPQFYRHGGQFYTTLVNTSAVGALDAWGGIAGTVTGSPTSAAHPLIYQPAPPMPEFGGGVAPPAASFDALLIAP